MIPELRVLLVEDSEAEAVLLEETLAVSKAASFHLDLATRLADAIVRLRTAAYDAILLDLGLPDSQGLATVAAMAAACRGTPVLVMTGHDDELTALAALTAGAQDYLVKGQVTGAMLGRTIVQAITRSRTERALREREEQLRLITETVSEAFYLVEAEPLRVVHLSAAFERIWGTSRDAVYEDAQRFFATVHPEDRARVTCDVARRRAGEMLYTEYRIVRGDGQIRWIADQSFDVVGGEGVARRYIGTAADITDRKLASEELRRTNEQLARTLETADAIAIVDRTGRITFANAGAEKLLGVPREGIAARTFDDPTWKIARIDGTPMPADELPAMQVLTTGAAVFGVEHAIEWPDGKRVVLSVNAAPLRDGAGGVEAVVATMRDVTAAYDAADRLRLQATLLDAVGQVVCACDGKGAVTFWSSQAEKLLGWPAADVVGRPVSAVLPVGRWHDAIMEGESVSGERLVACRDGRTRPSFVTGAPIRDGIGRATGAVFTSTDLTDVKRLEEDLRHAQRMEAIGRVAGAVAHDFNNILTVIQGGAQAMLDDLPASHPLREDAEEIVKAAWRAAGLTKQLLAFSRKQVTEPRVLDPVKVVEDMERMLRRLLGADVDLVFACSGAVGRVRADLGQMEQVIMNLAVNARDAMHGRGTLRLELESQEERAAGGSCANTFVILRVRDTGSGIPADILPHIFEPFFTTKGPASGTGLGLATVHGIVHQSGGRIEVTSEVGRGTTFHIYLPRVDEPLGELPARRSSARPVVPATILLVDDEDPMRSLQARVLRRLGYTVLEARGGPEALRLCEEHEGKIDLLLTDVVMPEMSGTEVASHAVSRRPGLRVLYMSGHIETVEKAGRPPAASLLEKPFASSVLAGRVREVLLLPATG
jgi:two-component system, cell cycle sensor histidine kinase and response regulator CckA